MSLLTTWWQKSLQKAEVRKHKNGVILAIRVGMFINVLYIETMNLSVLDARKNINILILIMNKTCKWVLCNSHSKVVMSCVFTLLLQIMLFSHESVFNLMIDLMLPTKFWV